MPSRKGKSSRRRPPPRRPKRRSDEPDPILSGRLLVALAMPAAMVLFPWPLSGLADAFVPKEEPKLDTSNWTPGKTVDVEITLITADYDRLACVSEQEYAGYHCEYKTETAKWERPEGEPLDDNNKNLIQPYSMSPDNQLILVGGLWAQPEVAFRVQQEPYQYVPEKKQLRFLAACRVRLVEQVPQATIRWNKTASWGKQGPAWVGVAESCKVLDKP